MKKLIIVAAVVAVSLAGCKSISFEKIKRTPVVDGTNVVAWAVEEMRGSYYIYGIQNEVEGLHITGDADKYDLTLDKGSTDMSEKNEKIVESSGTAAGKVIGEAVKAAATL